MRRLRLMSHQRQPPSILRSPDRPDTSFMPLLPCAIVYGVVPNTRRDDRAILPKICDIPRPTATPVSMARLAIASRECARRADNVAAGAIRPVPAPADVLRLRGETSHSAAPDRSRSGHRASAAPESAGEWDRPGQRRCDQAFSNYI